jgi:hypothetical protein
LPRQSSPYVKNDFGYKVARIFSTQKARMGPLIFTTQTEAKIPTTQGIYAFFLHNISISKVGFRGEGPYTENEEQVAKKALLKRVHQGIDFARSSELNGEIYETSKAQHIRRKYSIHAKEICGVDISENISSLDGKNLKDYISVCEFIPFFTNPIYVGITSEQTLQKRYFQHKKAYETGDTKSMFGGRLIESGLSWYDIVFACVPFETPVSNDVLLKLEKHLQALTRPTLSLR